MRMWRVIGRSAVRLGMLGAVCWGGWWLLMDPHSPLPPEWHPVAPLDMATPATALTPFKLRRAVRTPDQCLAALETGGQFTAMAPLEGDGACGIPNRVALSQVGTSRITQVETACATALRLALWEREVVQPTAQQILGQPVLRLRHQGSYNCRSIRGGARLSSHAFGAAIDIRAVVLADGREIPLLGNWEGDSPEARFWRALRDGACDWFVTVLGPEFDANHADHLHLQASGWGLCR